MRLPNPLSTKAGRLTTFFFLYMSEGLPQGFATGAVATEMRMQGVSPALVNGFVALILLPWSWKWAIGPMVDVCYSNRLGRRRGWIVAAQVMMVVTLMLSMPVDFSTHLKLFTILLMIHNIFAATQDVAIDALACNVLKEDERGMANGLMFGGAHLGNIAGSVITLKLASRFGDFNSTFYFIGAAILTITILVSLRLKEPVEEEDKPDSPADGNQLVQVKNEIVAYLRELYRAIVGSRAAFVGILFALLPAGACALSSPLQTSLAVELRLMKSEIANILFFTGMFWVGGCILGGLFSDRFGRRRMFALYILATIFPTIWLSRVMFQHSWILPIDPKAPDCPVPPETLLFAFFGAAMVYAVFNGLMYGARTALFMDITTPAVAATQFTAYMSLLNLTTSYSAAWQGFAIEKLGYPNTLAIDACVGLLCLGLLPLMTKPKPPDDEPETEETTEFCQKDL